MDKKAFQLLKIHSQPQNNLILILPIDRVKTVYAGDVVNCEILAANLPMSQYIILETVHRTSGMITLKLGKYYIGLDDTFAELFLQSKKSRSYNRRKILQKMKMTLISLVI